MNNYDRIKSMSVEEMADFITDLTNGCEYGCMYCTNYVDGECIKDGYMNDYVKGCIQWLLQEVSENDSK